MKKIILISLVIIILIISLLYYRHITKPHIQPTEFEFDKDAYKNFLDYVLDRALEMEPTEGMDVVAFTANSYQILGYDVPRKQEIIDHFNSYQKVNGTWGDIHWAPKTANILMTMDSIGSKPAKSLDPYFEKTDTWSELKYQIESDIEWGGFWGEAWGHAGIYAVEGRCPAWRDEYYTYTAERFNAWAPYSHQINHMAMSFYHLNLDVPRKQEAINIILSKQNLNGTWTPYPEAETPGVVIILNQLGASGPDVEQAKSREVEYLKSLYWYDDEKKMAAFIFKQGKPHPAPTILMALVLEGIIDGNPNAWDYKVC